jgi:hypothetical protein
MYLTEIFRAPSHEAYAAFKHLLSFTDLARRKHVRLTSPYLPPVEVRISKVEGAELEVDVRMDMPRGRKEASAVIHFDFANARAYPTRIRLAGVSLTVGCPGAFGITDAERLQQSRAADLLATFLTFLRSNLYMVDPQEEQDGPNAKKDGGGDALG